VTEEFHPGFRNSVAAYTVVLAQSQGHPGSGFGAATACGWLSAGLANFSCRWTRLNTSRSAPARPNKKWRNSLRAMRPRLAAYGQRLDVIADVLRDPSCSRRAAECHLPVVWLEALPETAAQRREFGQTPSPSSTMPIAP